MHICGLTLMDNKDIFNALQLRVLYSFYISLLRTHSDLSIESINKDLENKDIDSIIETNNIHIKTYLQNGKSTLTKKEIVSFMKTINEIILGNRQKIRNLDLLAENNNLISSEYIKARRLFLKKRRLRGHNINREDGFFNSAYKCYEMISYCLENIIRSLEEENKHMEKIPCNFYAETEKFATIGKFSTVRVHIALDEIFLHTKNISDVSETFLDPHKKLTIVIIPRINFEVVNNYDRKSISIPKEGEVNTESFALMPTHQGKGLIHISIRQSEIPVLTLVLEPNILEEEVYINEKENKHIKKIDNKKEICSDEGEMDSIPSRKSPETVLEITDRKNGDEVIYNYSFRCSNLNIIERNMEIKVERDRQNYIENIYSEINNRWVKSQDDIEMFSQELKQYGWILLVDLFPEKLIDILWKNKDNIKTIWVLSSEPFIPWELIHLEDPIKKQPSKENYFLGQMGLIRWIDSSRIPIGYPPEKIIVKRNKISCIFPEYKRTEDNLPNLKEELEYLINILGAKQEKADRFSVRELLKDANFDLLHFAGHGRVEKNGAGVGKLTLEKNRSDSKDGKDYIGSDDVSAIFRNNNDDENMPIIVINACEAGMRDYRLNSVGGFSQAFIEKGAGAFIGPLWQVGDSQSVTFIKTFYESLIQGLSLSQATTKAREEGRKMSDATWLSYAVYGDINLKVIFV